MITRDGEPSAALRDLQQYRLRVCGDSRTESFSHPFLTYHPKALDSAAAQSCVERLEESDILAVSVGVRQLEQVANLVAMACRRPDCPPLHLLAFENAPGASQKLLEGIKEANQRLGAAPGQRQLIAHTAIPDRACTRRLEGGSVVIDVERFGEILLEESARDLFEEILAPEPESPLPIVRYVSTEAIFLGELRKFWLVNGTHTALGVLCAEAGLQLLNDGLSEEWIATQLRALHREWVQVLHNLAVDRMQAVGLFGDAELAAHAERMFERLRDLPDFSVKDVLRELTELAASDKTAKALQRLLQKLDDRLATAVRTASQLGDIAVPTSGRILATGVGTVRWFADTYLM